MSYICEYLVPISFANSERKYHNEPARRRPFTTLEKGESIQEYTTRIRTWAFYETYNVSTMLMMSYYIYLRYHNRENSDKNQLRKHRLINSPLIEHGNFFFWSTDDLKLVNGWRRHRLMIGWFNNSMWQ